MQNDLIEEFGEDITIRRTPAGNYVNGVFQAGTPVDTLMHAAVLPLAEREAMTIVSNAGQDMRDGIVVFVDPDDGPVTSADENNRIQPDQFLWRSRWFTVQSVQLRQQLTELAHWRAVALLNDT